ncbi:hypothetical protein D3C71_1729110 [compost metagenome]
MLKAFAELGDGNDGNELPRRDPDDLGYRNKDHIPNHVIQQVVAVVAPHGHLLLGMVQRMQAPPPFEMMLSPVNPVIHKIKHHQIEKQADPPYVGDSWPEPVHMERAEPSNP